MLNSRSQSPNKPIGFGNLLAGAQLSDENQKHSTLSDLMVPTGEHDALLAPDRREPSGTSAFDEIQAQVNADEASVVRSLSPGSLSEPPADSAAMRMDDKPQAPSFSSLFSSEIVTSGQDFSDNIRSTPAFGDTAGATDSDLLEPGADQSEDESRFLNPKSLAISKLIEAVNQSESREVGPGTTGDTKSDLSSSEIVGAISEPTFSPADSSDHPPISARFLTSGSRGTGHFCPSGGRRTA